MSKSEMKRLAIQQQTRHNPSDAKLRKLAAMYGIDIDERRTAVQITPLKMLVVMRACFNYGRDVDVMKTVRKENN